MAEQQNLSEVFNSLTPVTEIESIDGQGNQAIMTPTKTLEPIAFGNFPRDHFVQDKKHLEPEMNSTPAEGGSKRKPIITNIQKHVGIWAGKFAQKLTINWKGKPLSQYRANDDINLKSFVIIPLLKPQDALDYITECAYSFKGSSDGEGQRCFAVLDSESNPVVLLYPDGFDGPCHPSRTKRTKLTQPRDGGSFGAGSSGGK